MRKTSNWAASFLLTLATTFSLSLNAAGEKVTKGQIAACNGGDLQVCSDVATSYWPYKHDQRDAEKYFEYGSKACTGNAIFTCFQVAYAYSVGIGTKADGEKAYEYFTNICEAKAKTEQEKKTKRKACGQVEIVAERLGIEPNPEKSDSSNNKRNLPDLSKSTGVVNFFITNSCSSSSPINVIFRESYEGEVTGYKWPSEGYYSFKNRGVTETVSIKCAYPSSVCYGATTNLSSKSYSWGLGLNHDRGCKTCCYACPLRSTGYGYTDVRKNFICN